MKISYNVLKKYIPDLGNPENIAELLTMHTAEVEEINYESESLNDIYTAKVVSVEKHSNSEHLNICKVEHQGKILQIVCGAPNVRPGIVVPLAIIGANLGGGFIIKTSKIRGETSEGMICSEDEIGLTDIRQEGIMILPQNTPLDITMREYLPNNDTIIIVDNKAINHRPDLFSHIGIARELEAIQGRKLDFQYIQDNFSHITNELTITNKIPQLVRRYLGVKMSGVKNIESPQYIKEILNTESVESKGLLIDITNYSLYLYGQPTHCFDADTLNGNIVVRSALEGEKFTALNDKEYILNAGDIVIADQGNIIALGGIIGGKYSAVTDSTTNIIIESAHFDQASLRKTGKAHGLRTDALNLFEKDLQADMAETGASLIISEITKHIDTANLVSYNDIYSTQQEIIPVEFDLEFINRLIGKTYNETDSLTILENLGIENINGTLHIPFWRKDISRKADIAEEIARIDGYNNIAPSITSVQTGAILQTPLYILKKDARNFWVHKGYYDMYNYSFVGNTIMNKFSSCTDNLIALKNSLSEDATHMKDSHLPHLLKTLGQNIKQFKNLHLFEIEKVYQKHGDSLSESNVLSGVFTSKEEAPYYTVQSHVSDFLSHIGITKFSFERHTSMLPYTHSGRTASLIIRGKPIGLVGEIHPLVVKNFKIAGRIAFFEINIDLLINATYNIIQAKEISEFQENTFDLSFTIQKETKGIDIQGAIEKTDVKNIKKVELFDIYENQETLPGQRSISFKIYTQSLEGTLDDNYKNTLIKNIIARVETKGGTLR